MAIRMTLVCHAATASMRTTAFPEDEPIEDRAMPRIAALASRLRRVDRSWTAPERRTRQTSETLHQAAQVEPIPLVETELRECDYGRWRGRSFADIQQVEGGQALLAWSADPAAAPHGGETLLAMLERTAAWLDRQAGTSGHGLVVAHASTIRGLVLHAIGAPPASFWRIDIAPLSLTTLSFNRQWRLGSAGCTMSADQASDTQLS